jgi:SsrA-binding protein
MKCAENAKAHHDFDLMQTFEGGLALTGAEVKSIKSGNVNLKGSFLSFTNGELFLKNAHVGHYAPSGHKTVNEEQRDRKILVHKKEIDLIRGKHEAERLTLVPLSIYTSRGLIKISFALARGKRKWEKRADIKKRDLDRSMRRGLE